MNIMIRNSTRSKEVEKYDDICDDDSVDSGWWRNANIGECPITLECLSTLEYPPFALYRNNDNNSGSNSTTNHGKVSAYFDGLALASYVVSRGVFQNPLTRADLTANDCRRLDRYLEDHCYSSYTSSSSSSSSSSSGNNVSDNHKHYDLETKTMLTMMMGKRGGTKAMSVAEAFALRNSVHVARSDGVNDNNNARIQTLQNAATAALAGLFVYGNDRSGPRGHRSANESDRQVQSSSDPFNEWGYDLSRRVEDTSTEGGHGYTVIDDDEAIVVASQRYVYEAVQIAFPPLSNETLNNTYDGEPRNNNVASIDERLLERVRTLSIQDQENKRRHARELEQARKELLRQALERRRQKQRERIDCSARNTEHYQSQQKDEEELMKARGEIERWRDDQWEKLRILSEERQSNEKISNAIIRDSCDPEDHIDTTNRDKDNGSSAITSNDDEVAVIDNEIPTTATAHERKKAKAAAKRKRAKEKKKTQKSLEKKETEKLQREEAKEAKKAASVLKCRLCGTGIPKPSMAFSRLDQLFCSSKCARTAVKSDST